jgi:virulence factor
MLQNLISKIKNKRKQGYLGINHKKKYAFVGIGSHSINNLYPVINYFRLDLKYIVTNSADNAKLIDRNFAHSIGTVDLERVLQDEEIAGIFICANPGAHFGLVKKVLQANKNVFVEKPPCLNLEELKELVELEKLSTGSCLVGFQKQYAPANLALKKQLKNSCSYNYRYVTGGYPEGDPFLEIFIHPISLLLFLFGRIDSSNILHHQTKGGLTLSLQLDHSNHSMGTIELSTDYSWVNATEKLIVNTEKGIYKISDTEELTFEPKAGTVLKVPKEKIFKLANKTVTLSQRNNFNPVFENNQIYSSGYFSEIDNFIQICESGRGKNNSTLSGCFDTYELINAIKRKMNVQ